LRISGQHTRLQKQFRDPQRNIGLTSGQESTASTTRNAITLTKHGDIFSFLSDLSYSSALVGRNDALRDSSSAIKREITSAYVGSEIKILPNLLLEIKGDRFIAPESPSSNIGATVYVASDFFNIWLQAAKHERPPTLLEVQGNGVEIEPAANLENEHGDFMEIGSRTYTNIGPWTGEWSLTYWQDYLRDRLRIKPISATLWRASNVDRESYRGAELRNRWENQTIEIELAGAYTDAKQSNSLRIAKVPLWQSVVAGAWVFVPDWKIRLSQRFQGRYFYDDLETLEVSETSFQDITLDRHRPNSPWTLGISCTNVSNNLSTRFSDVSTNQGQGQIAKESINGDPLPGRQFAISFKTLLP